MKELAQKTAVPHPSSEAVSGQRVTELRRLPPSPCGMKETLGKPWAGQDLEVNCKAGKGWSLVSG